MFLGVGGRVTLGSTFPVISLSFLLWWYSAPEHADSAKTFIGNGPAGFLQVPFSANSQRQPQIYDSSMAHGLPRLRDKKHMLAPAHDLPNPMYIDGVAEQHIGPRESDDVVGGLWYALQTRHLANS